MKLKLFAGLVLLVPVLAFVIQNKALVTITLFEWHFQISLALLVLSAVLLGVILGVLMGYSRKLRKARLEKRAQKQLKKQQQSPPVTPPPPVEEPVFEAPVPPATHSGYTDAEYVDMQETERSDDARQR